MRFQVQHRTAYTYETPVRLGPQRVRLRPRGDNVAVLEHWELTVDPEPSARLGALDGEGNRVTTLWFEEPTERLCLRSLFTLHTEPAVAAARCPQTPGWDTATAPELRRRFLPCLALREGDGDPAVAALSEELRRRTGNPLAFLAALNGHLHGNLEREIRAAGGPLPPAETLRRGRGACRDLSVLFAAACRIQGLAVRFVSGYQARSERGGGERHMHAWPEVYLGELGWRGFDPTHGTDVGEAHVAVAAAADPQAAAPVSGSYFGTSGGPAGSALEVEVRIAAGDYA
jgi:transglutaminase-like putative cysteine protease